MGFQRLLDVMHNGDIGRIIERAFFQLAGCAQHLFNMLVACFSQIDRALFLIKLVIASDKIGDNAVDGIIEFGFIIRGAGDDQRRARFIDEDGIHFIDNGEGMTALHHLREVIFHIVAQIIKTKFIVGAIGNVGRIGLAALFIIKAMHNDTYGQAQETIDLAHPLRVAAGEIIIYRHHMHALAIQGIEISGQRGDQGLAFTGAHFSNATFMQHHAADQLHIKMTLTQRSLGAFSHGGKSGNEQIVEFGALRQLLTKVLSPGAQIGIRERGQFCFKGIDGHYFGRIGLEASIIGCAEDPLHERAEHALTLLSRSLDRSSS